MHSQSQTALYIILWCVLVCKPLILLNTSMQLSHRDYNHRLFDAIPPNIMVAIDFY